jgi:thiol-disulfide isomerase/thioredoxin
MAKGLIGVLLSVVFSFAGDLLFFYDESCGYCKLQAEELVKNKDCVARHRVYLIEINRDREKAMEWGVYFVPTMFLVENGRYKKVEGVLLGRDLRKFLGCGQ